MSVICRLELKSLPSKLLSPFMVFKSEYPTGCTINNFFPRLRAMIADMSKSTFSVSHNPVLPLNQFSIQIWKGNSFIIDLPIYTVFCSTFTINQRMVGLWIHAKPMEDYFEISCYLKWKWCQNLSSSNCMLSCNKSWATDVWCKQNTGRFMNITNADFAI